MRKSAVVSWYLEQLVGQGQIENEDELLERKTLVEKVIDRLMYHVSIFHQHSVNSLCNFLFFLTLYITSYSARFRIIIYKYYT